MPAQAPQPPVHGPLGWLGGPRYCVAAVAALLSIVALQELLSLVTPIDQEADDQPRKE